MLFLTSCKQMHVASEKLHKEQDGTLHVGGHTFPQNRGWKRSDGALK